MKNRLEQQMAFALEIDKAKNIGVKDEDAELLSYFFVDENKIKEFADNKDYQNLSYLKKSIK